MKNKLTIKVYYLFSIVLSLSSCINKDQFEKKEKAASNVESIQVEIKFAKGFSVEYFDGGKHVKVLHPKNGEVLDEFILLNKDLIKLGYEEAKLKRFKLPLENVVSQSTTHVSYLDKIESLNSLKAVAFAEWVKNENAQKRFLEGQLQNLSAGGKLNKELLVDLDPELIFMYPFDQDAVENIREHVPFVLTTEYLETSTMAKLEWVKFFALFYNQEELATRLFDEIASRYDSLKETQHIFHRYFMNLPFQGVWNCPPGNSYSVQLISDAGMLYEYQGTNQDENIQKSREEIIDECLGTPYWIIIAQRQAGFSMDDLKSEDPVYPEFSAVEQGNVLFCNTAESDYFGDALVEPDVLLSNLKEVISGRVDSTKYFRRLK